MGDVAIETDGLGKRYRLGLYRRGYGTLREAISGAFGRDGEDESDYDGPDFLWALRDLSLTIRSGEVVGLIGHNGAGKSTLLKVLSRITEPSAGFADVTGRVGSLLEVGTGFHPELTGRENVYLNGAILGMRRAEIRARFDEIVEFAEVERFLDTPVKRYSSGMSVRLAFAVAAHLEPEILLVDEVLAVGDASFQRKSLGKLTEVASEGRTVIFVSHNLAIIQALCTRGVLLERGEAVADGPVKVTIDGYLGALERAASDDLLERTDRDRRGYYDTQIKRVEIRNHHGGPPDVIVAGEPATIAVDLTEHLPTLECRITIVDGLGQPVTTFDSEVSAEVDVRDPSLDARIECVIRSLPLMPGRYRIDLLLKAGRQIQDGLQAAGFFEVQPGVVDGRPTPITGSDGDVVLSHLWRLPP
ncbi:MAG TPA: ABC transporter ATP-binding protein [Candidatus Dormibacteraeota bacterium]|nr:ABC transporter ATP-binding protein [Candidatus Dormibacteraeota bacterium]